MLQDNITLGTIKAIVWQFFPQSTVLLFGSRARQDHHDNSDYDILIITDKEMSPTEKLPFRTMIRKALLKKGIFSDILIQSHKDVELKKQLTGHIVKTILQEGIAL